MIFAGLNYFALFMTNAIWLSLNSSPGIFIFGHNPWRNGRSHFHCRPRNKTHKNNQTKTFLDIFPDGRRRRRPFFSFFRLRLFWTKKKKDSATHGGQNYLRLGFLFSKFSFFSQHKSEGENVPDFLSSISDTEQKHTRQEQLPYRIDKLLLVFTWVL